MTCCSSNCSAFIGRVSPGFVAFPVGGGDAEGEAIIFEQVNFASLDVEEVGLEICEYLVGGEIVCYGGKGRTNQLDYRVLIEGSSLVYEDGDGVIFETGLDVVFVRVDIGCDDGDVAVSAAGVSD